MSGESSPRPWYAGEVIPEPCHALFDAQGRALGGFSDIEDREFALRAVNAHDALVALLREQLDAERLWMTDATAAFEREAEAFYRETRMLAPGKDDRRGEHSYEERRARWKAWNDAKRDARHARWADILLTDPTTPRRSEP